MWLFKWQNKIVNSNLVKNVIIVIFCVKNKIGLLQYNKNVNKIFLNNKNTTQTNFNQCDGIKYHPYWKFFLRTI